MLRKRNPKKNKRKRKLSLGHSQLKNLLDNKRITKEARKVKKANNNAGEEIVVISKREEIPEREEEEEVEEAEIEVDVAVEVVIITRRLRKMKMASRK